MYNSCSVREAIQFTVSNSRKGSSSSRSTATPPGHAARQRLKWQQNAAAVTGIKDAKALNQQRANADARSFVWLRLVLFTAVRSSAPVVILRKKNLQPEDCGRVDRARITARTTAVREGGSA